MAQKCRVLQSGICSITQPYHINGQLGYNYNHWGIDLTGFNGSYNVLDWEVAHSDGVVTATRNDCMGFEAGSYGNYVMLRHGNGYYTMYAHMAYGTVQVRAGQTVKKGQVLGYMGNTGESYGGHLHWEVRQPNGYQIDPQPFLDADLPKNGGGHHVVYQIWDDIHRTWQPNVTDLQDYAGIFGSDICCVYAEATDSTNVYYRVHTWAGDGTERHIARWLPQVVNRSDYAGVYKTPIDAFAIRADKPIKYRAHLRKENKWLPWVTGYSVSDAENGYAGIIGHPIDAIQIVFI